MGINFDSTHVVAPVDRAHFRVPLTHFSFLVRRRDGKLFAMCKVEDGAVERVPDSSRYFVIKIQNAQGRHAFVGLAFDDRNQAFDFNVALQEFKK